MRMQDIYNACKLIELIKLTLKRIKKKKIVLPKYGRDEMSYLFQTLEK